MCHFWMVAGRAMVCFNILSVFCHRTGNVPDEDDSAIVSWRKEDKERNYRKPMMDT